MLGMTKLECLGHVTSHGATANKDSIFFLMFVGP